jgi:hypothetical protein
MNSTSYQPPVDKLLTLGLSLRLNMGKQEYDYILELGLGSQHIPDLMRMGVDRALLNADSGSLDAWAAIHAWRALGQLHAEDAIAELTAGIAPLIQLFHELADNELVSEELPKFFSKIGAIAIPQLAIYLADDSHKLFSRVNAINSLEEIAQQNENLRNDCILVLTQQLESYQKNSSELNGFIVAALINLQGISSAPVIKLAFAVNQVAEDIVGSWEDVKESLGISTDDELQELKTEVFEEVVEVVKVAIPMVEITVPIPAVDIETEASMNVVIEDGMSNDKLHCVYVDDSNDYSVEINAAEELPVDVAEISPDNSEEANIVNHDLLVTEEVLEETISGYDVISEVEITVEEIQSEVNVVEIGSNLSTQDEISIEIRQGIEIREDTEIIEKTKAIKETNSVDTTLVESNNKEEIRGFGKVGITKDKDKDKEKEQNKFKQKKKKRNFVDL